MISDKLLTVLKINSFQCSFDPEFSLVSYEDSQYFGDLELGEMS